MPFKVGQSGNPKGRALNSRALSQILTEAGDVDVRGMQHVKRKEFLAERVWQYICDGETTLGNGQMLRVTNGRDWLDAVKWLYTHIDGAARPDLFSGDVQVMVIRGGNGDSASDAGISEVPQAQRAIGTEFPDDQ